MLFPIFFFCAARECVLLAAAFCVGQLEQQHARELEKLQSSIANTLGKQREQRKQIIAENEHLRSTIQCVDILPFFCRGRGFVRLCLLMYVPNTFVVQEVGITNPSHCRGAQ